MAVIRQSVRLGAIVAVLLSAVAGAGAAGLAKVGPQSGLPLPRFVSLKPDRVNVRGGPGRDHRVDWIYTRAGLPVEITAEFGNWRRIRDWEGAEGWVYHSLLSGRRTALVMPQNKGALLPIYDEASTKGDIAARLQSGVQASIRECTGRWCHLTGPRFDGWIEQNLIWGAYPNEKVE